MEINIIEKISESLIELDSDKKDHKITITEFNAISTKTDYMELLTGHSNIEDWNDFKTLFIKHQSDHGFHWVPLQGYAGPIGLESVILPPEIGAEIAQELLNTNIKEGNFLESIQKFLPMLTNYIIDSKDILNFSEARSGFKEASKNNQGYRFTPGRNSQNFVLAINEYTFSGDDSRKTEHEFGEYIKSELQDKLKLNVLEHSQSGRAAGKYQNVDFEGFKVSKGITTDEFLMYNFELKPSNKISSVSEAISQAINYKNEAHFTYIVIPNFNQDSFYNPERFGGFMDLCRTNHIGIISIEMDSEKDKLTDIIEVLPAARTELESITSLLQMIEQSDWELCALCNRIVNKYSRTQCPWKVQDKDEEVKCMKLLMEKKFTS